MRVAGVSDGVIAAAVAVSHHRCAWRQRFAGAHILVVKVKADAAHRVACNTQCCAQRRQVCCGHRGGGLPVVDLGARRRSQCHGFGRDGARPTDGRIGDGVVASIVARQCQIAEGVGGRTCMARGKLTIAASADCVGEGARRHHAGHANRDPSRCGGAVVGLGGVVDIGRQCFRCDRQVTHDGQATEVGVGAGRD